MLRKTKAFLPLLIVASMALAPQAAKSQTQIGLRGAYNMSTVSFKPTREQKLLFGAGVDAGVVLKYYKEKYVGIQFEVNIVQRGYQTPYNQTDLYKRINTYIEVPMFFQVQLPIRKVSLFGNAGCYAAYLLQAKDGNNASGSFDMKKYKFNYLYDKRFDYGLAGGVGFNYNFNFASIQAEYRTYLGLADLFDHSYRDMPSTSHAFVQSINLSFLFPIDKIFGSKADSKTEGVIPSNTTN